MPTVDWSHVDWKWVFTTLLAAWGACLSTYQAWTKRRETKTDVRVSLNLNVVRAGGRSHGERFIRIDVRNHGFRPVTFAQSCSCLEVDGLDRKLALPIPITQTTFPVTLASGQAFTMLAMYVAVAGELVKHEQKLGGMTVSLASAGLIRAVVWDQLSQEFRSDWVVYENFDAMLRQ
jgi:hypothetical protein